MPCCSYDKYLYTTFNGNIMKQDSTVIIYVDGACLVNPGGPGGYGVVLNYKGNIKHITGGEYSTTSNRMELMAAIVALEALTRPCRVIIYSDSKYVVRGMSEWITNWKQKNWKAGAKNPVKNTDLWKRLDQVSQCHTIDWQWVKGHAGNQGNELADQLANDGMRPYIKGN